MKSKTDWVYNRLGESKTNITKVSVIFIYVCSDTRAVEHFVARIVQNPQSEVRVSDRFFIVALLS